MTQLIPKNATWSAELTGIAAFLPLIQNSMEKDFALMDGIALPLAMIILGLILKSLRLLILPLVTMGVSALTSFMVMYFCTFLIGILFFSYLRLL
jgi:predicted RND superfamily exporter protein